ERGVVRRHRLTIRPGHPLPDRERPREFVLRGLPRLRHTPGRRRILSRRQRQKLPRKPSDHRARCETGRERVQMVDLLHQRHPQHLRRLRPRRRRGLHRRRQRHDHQQRRNQRSQRRPTTPEASPSHCPPHCGLRGSRSGKVITPHITMSTICTYRCTTCDIPAKLTGVRIMISADMEGATGVTWTDDVVPGTEQWQRFRRLFTGDVNAVITGLYEGGATDVLVNEAHSSQRNLLLEDLDPRARMLTGRHKPLSMMEGIDTGVDGVVFLGYHAAAGCDGVLSHTYLPNQITGVWLDGVLASEGRLNAALAAEYGVPVLLI